METMVTVLNGNIFVGVVAVLFIGGALYTRNALKRQRKEAERLKTIDNYLQKELEELKTINSHLQIIRSSLMSENLCMTVSGDPSVYCLNPATHIYQTVPMCEKCAQSWISRGANPPPKKYDFETETFIH